MSGNSSIALAFSDSKTLKVEIKPTARAKRFRLVAGISGIRAVVPIDYNPGDLQAFVESRKDWIHKAFLYYDKLRQKIGASAEGVEESAYFLGKRYAARIVKDRQNSVTISDNLGIITFHVTDRRRHKHFVRQWYREQTSRIISERLQIVNETMNLSYNKVSIKYQRSRWGSCSKKRNLNFNLLLSAAPVEVIDYVIIHELAHLVEFGHSSKFWALVESYDANYKKHKEWLADHSPVVN